MICHFQGEINWTQWAQSLSKIALHIGANFNKLSWKNGHTLCFPDRFAPWNTLLQSGLVNFASQLIFLLNTLYSLTHFTPQHLLLYSTLCSQECFSPQHTLLPRTLCFLCSREQSMLQRTFYKGAKCSREQSVPRSRVFQEAECAGEQSVSYSKVFQRSKRVEEQKVLRSKVWVCKVCQGAKSVSALCWSKLLCRVRLQF